MNQRREESEEIGSDPQLNLLGKDLSFLESIGILVEEARFSMQKSGENWCKA